MVLVQLVAAILGLTVCIFYHQAVDSESESTAQMETIVFISASVETQFKANMVIQFFL
jgi:hypothetical protein